MDIFGTKKNFETEALEARVVAQEERIRVLEAAVHKLIEITQLDGTGKSGGRGGIPIQALEPFVTYHDLMHGRVIRPGVGDPAKVGGH